MAQVEHIQAEIEELSGEDFARLRQWFAEKDWQRWGEMLLLASSVFYPKKR